MPGDKESKTAHDTPKTAKEKARGLDAARKRAAYKSTKPDCVICSEPMGKVVHSSGCDHTVHDICFVKICQT
jgi:hypothetical protein